MKIKRFEVNFKNLLKMKFFTISFVLNFLFSLSYSQQLVLSSREDISYEINCLNENLITLNDISFDVTDDKQINYYVKFFTKKEIDEGRVFLNVKINNFNIFKKQYSLCKLLDDTPEINFKCPLTIGEKIVNGVADGSKIPNGNYLVSLKVITNDQDLLCADILIEWK